MIKDRAKLIENMVKDRTKLIEEYNKKDTRTMEYKSILNPILDNLQINIDWKSEDLIEKVIAQFINYLDSIKVCYVEKHREETSRMAKMGYYLVVDFCIEGEFKDAINLYYQNCYGDSVELYELEDDEQI